MQLNLNNDDIRPPAIAGTFYPHNPDELADTVRHYLTQAGRFFDPAHKAPKAIIAPHAGYIYIRALPQQLYTIDYILVVRP